VRTDSRVSDEADDKRIDRNRLDPDVARSHFLRSRVDATDVDFSDKINGGRHSYQVSSRRSRRIVGNGESGSDSDEEEGVEGLRKKLARLQREAAELKSEFERAENEGEATEDEGDDASLRQLDQSLRSLNETILKEAAGAHKRLSQRIRSSSAGAASESSEFKGTESSRETDRYTITYAPSYQSSQALAKAASFDTRLAFLEKIVGIDTMPLPSQQGSYPKPVLPSLDILDRQLSVLTSSSGASLEAVSKRVRQLTTESERLEEARRSAKDANEALLSTAESLSQPARSGQTKINGTSDLASEDPDQVAKINALHGTLPTIELVAPTLPGLLDRLRSLRLIHADAGDASRSLNELEKRQAEMEDEMGEWQESLGNVEQIMRGGEKALKENIGIVEEWVKELESRVQTLVS